MLFSNIFGKKEVSVDLDTNVRLTVIPVTGGVVYAVLYKYDGIFTRQEHEWFTTLDDLVGSLNLTDETIIRKLSKAF